MSRRDSPVQVAIVWSRAARQASGLANVRALNTTARHAVRAAVESVLQLHRNAKDAESSTRTDTEEAWEVVVSIVSDQEIHAMNVQYRHKGKPTDVLSFAQDEGAAFPPAAFPPAAFPPAAFSSQPFSPDENSSVCAHMLGDVVISIETAQRQAIERAHSLEHEVQFLCVHGTLHLQGFDHMEARDRRRMWKQQDAVMEWLAQRR